MNDEVHYSNKAIQYSYVTLCILVKHRALKYEKGAILGSRTVCSKG